MIQKDFALLFGRRKIFVAFSAANRTLIMEPSSRALNKTNEHFIRGKCLVSRFCQNDFFSSGFHVTYWRNACFDMPVT